MRNPLPDVTPLVELPLPGNAISFPERLEELRPAIDRALDALLPPSGSRPARLVEAMRYSVFAGGKRLRPALVLVAGERFGAAVEPLLPAAAAIELIHTYSLVHDDLPALDDDDLRRGHPTAHRAYDEATAILVGDALLTLGLTTLAKFPSSVAAGLRAHAVELVGEAIGTSGMIGGQVEDLEAEVAWPDEPEAALARIHSGKTAALIAACLRLGGLYAGVDAATDERLGELGACLGLLFQVRDDLLDVVGTSGELGKTPGKDARAAKLTYPGLFGLEPARRRMAELARRARELTGSLPGDAKLLASLADFLAKRTF